MNLRGPAVLLVGIALACRTGRDYADPRGPRYADTASRTRTASDSRGTMHVASFNIAFAKNIDDAIRLINDTPSLLDADILLLQEMDASGTRRIATALGMAYVYYPALFHLKAQHDFGNAVLSRWPIVDDGKLVLPHKSRFAGTHRIATATTIRFADSLVRVYSVHLGTPADISGASRRDQLRAIMEDANSYGHVVIGGDMNSRDVGRIARASGYAWPSEHGPRTTLLGRWDHFFLKGLCADSAAGTVHDVRGVSDHNAIFLSTHWCIAPERNEASMREHRGFIPGVLLQEYR